MMSKTFAFTALAFAAATACFAVSTAFAADSDVTVSRRSARAPAAHCETIQKCGPDGCRSRRVCGSPCPDGYSCYSLYGAYPPYGGTLYWGAYTDAGWGRHY